MWQILNCGKSETISIEDAIEKIEANLDSNTMCIGVLIDGRPLQIVRLCGSEGFGLSDVRFPLSSIIYDKKFKSKSLFTLLETLLKSDKFRIKVFLFYSIRHLFTWAKGSWYE